MKASLCLEYIGEGFSAREKLYSLILRESVGGNDSCEVAKIRKPWVAEVLGFGGKFGVDRNFLRGSVQRQRSSGIGNRRVEMWFICESGKIYQAQHFVSWKSKERFFFVVTESGEIEKVTEQWAKDRLALMFSPPHGNA